ncbi:uncharacterized protein TRIADDRAFT_28737, partial [Trichoplax adhaerens]
AYHSSFANQGKSIGNVALLPINTSYKGPAPKGDGSPDIIEEALYLFKANIWFKNYEVKSDADRTLIYLTLYISECLKKLQKCPTKNAGTKELYTEALTNVVIPGEAGFPLSSLYQKPSKSDGDLMRLYFTQLRQELGVRLLEKVYCEPDGKPSKWWMCFSRKKFMDKRLGQP